MGGNDFNAREDEKDAQNILSLILPAFQISLSYINTKNRSTHIFDMDVGAVAYRDHPVEFRFYDEHSIADKNSSRLFQKLRWKICADIFLGKSRLMITQHTAPLLLDFFNRI